MQGKSTITLAKNAKQSSARQRTFKQEGKNSRVKKANTSMRRIKLKRKYIKSRKICSIQKNLGQESEMEKKVILHMASRIKSDKIVYDQRKYDVEKQYASIIKNKALIEKESAHNLEEQDRARKVYIKLSEHFQAENRERSLHIANLERMLQQKNQLVQYTTIHGAEMNEISENALQDKDQKQKNWYKVYLCHRFVEKLLRDKMNREMTKFGSVEHAFKTIKTETGVGDVLNLVSKFLNKESIYDGLLGKIAGDQKQIRDLKTLNQQFTRQRNNLQSENAVLSSNKKDKTELSHKQKQLLNISEKTTNCQLFYEKMKLWLHKNLRKIQKLDNKRKQQSVQEEKFEIASSFKEYLTFLGNIATSTKEITDQDLILSQIAKSKVNQRIKMSEQADEAGKKNQTKEKDEDQFVKQQRENLHKDNQKFMRQLKKKYQEIRKNKIDAQPKKKDTSPEKPKNPEGI